MNPHRLLAAVVLCAACAQELPASDTQKFANDLGSSRLQPNGEVIQVTPTTEPTKVHFELQANLTYGALTYTGPYVVIEPPLDDAGQPRWGELGVSVNTVDDFSAGKRRFAFTAEVRVGGQWKPAGPHACRVADSGCLHRNVVVQRQDPTSVAKIIDPASGKANWLVANEPGLLNHIEALRLFPIVAGSFEPIGEDPMQVLPGSLEVQLINACGLQGQPACGARCTDGLCSGHCSDHSAIDPQGQCTTPFNFAAAQPKVFEGDATLYSVDGEGLAMQCRMKFSDEFGRLPAQSPLAGVDLQCWTAEANAEGLHQVFINENLVLLSDGSASTGPRGPDGIIFVFDNDYETFRIRRGLGATTISLSAAMGI